MPEQNQNPSISDRLLMGQYLTQEEYNALPDTSNIVGVALTYATQGTAVIPAIAIFADAWSKRIYDVAKKYRELGLPVIRLPLDSNRPHMMFVPVRSPEELEPAIIEVMMQYRQMLQSIYASRIIIEQMLRSLN